MAPAPSGSASAVSTMLAATATAPRTRGLAPGASSSSRAHVPTPTLLCLYLGLGGRRRRCGARNADVRCRRRLLTARGERPRQDDEGEEEEEEAAGFDAAVALFNRGEYHACHDVVEELWYGAEDPARTLLHGLLQCAVGFHHLFNQNHRGAMMELGEGLCKLRKLRLEDDGHPFSLFRDEVAAVLHFLYRTQKELAACTEEMCLTMDGSPSSYQLLGNFAAGQRLYGLEAGSIVFFSAPNNGGGGASRAAPPHTVKLPTLQATEQHLTALQSTSYEYM